MSGPIIRSGPSDEYTSNWSKAFGEKATKKKATKATKKKAATKKKKKKSK